MEPRKSLPALLQERLRWLNEYDAACVALQKATHPDPSPAQQAAEAREELVGCGRSLSQADQRVPTVSCRRYSEASPVKVSSALGSEMKDAIESTSHRVEGLENQAGNTAERDRQLEQSA